MPHYFQLQPALQSAGEVGEAANPMKIDNFMWAEQNVP